MLICLLFWNFTIFCWLFDGFITFIGYLGILLVLGVLCILLVFDVWLFIECLGVFFVFYCVLWYFGLFLVAVCGIACGCCLLLTCRLIFGFWYVWILCVKMLGFGVDIRRKFIGFAYGWALWCCVWWFAILVCFSFAVLCFSLGCLRSLVVLVWRFVVWFVFECCFIIGNVGDFVLCF